MNEKNLKTSQAENLGAELCKRINHGKNSEYFINSDSVLKLVDDIVWALCDAITLLPYLVSLK